MSTQQPAFDSSSKSAASKSQSSLSGGWKKFNRQRVRFFARREAFFLWILGGGLLIFGLYWLARLLFWTAGQGSVLENFLLRDWTPW